MRCLYCGKELALLKRWTGGGEFCSDAHRQRYQEEYNQLALNRLLQAKPAEAKEELKSNTRSKSDVNSGEVKSKGKPEVKPEPRVETHPEPRTVSNPEPRREPAYAAHPRQPGYEMPAIAVADRPEVAASKRVVTAEPVVASAPVVAPPPVVAAAPVIEEAVAPAPLGGFVRKAPELTPVEVAQVTRFELEWMQISTPALPLRSSGPVDFSNVQLGVGAPLSLELSGRFRDCEASPRDRRLEIRDFVRVVPIVEVKLGGTEENIMEMPTRQLEIVIPAKAPVESTVLWQEGVREFHVPEVELGALARLAFGTTGLEDKLESGEAAGVVASVETSLEPETVSTLEPPPIEVQAAPLAAIEALAAPPEIVEATTQPKPEAQPVTEPIREAIPELVHRSVPLTLHGLAAGRGKLVQIFTSALAPGIQVQLPRSTAVPLRPLMVLGPRLASTHAPAAPSVPPPVESKSDPKADLKKAAPPAKQDPRANAKKSKPGVRVITPPEEIPAEKKSPVAAASAKAEPTPEPAKPEPPRIQAVPPAAAKPETLKAAAASDPPVSRNVPVAAPLTPADLGPRLELASSQSAWSKLSSRARIGVAAVLALVLAGIVMIMAKGGGSPARAEGARVVEAGPALPITESGWITNWAAGEAGVRKTRDMSVLRASLNLTDYRVDLQGQIESKGMGWIVRAMNAKNFCVLRLEIIKPGLEPVVNFVRFATVGGEEESRLSLRLPFPVRIDTMYKIRTEVVGSTITTWIQDQKIDTWTNEHVKTGGAGLYYERGERASLKGGLNVIPLTLRN